MIIRKSVSMVFSMARVFQKPWMGTGQNGSRVMTKTVATAFLHSGFMSG